MNLLIHTIHTHKQISCRDMDNLFNKQNMTNINANINISRTCLNMISLHSIWTPPRPHMLLRQQLIPYHNMTTQQVTGHWSVEMLCMLNLIWHFFLWLFLFRMGNAHSSLLRIARSARLSMNYTATFSITFFSHILYFHLYTACTKNKEKETSCLLEPPENKSFS